MNFNYCPSCGQKASIQKQDDTNYECRSCGWHFWNNAKAAATIVLMKDRLILLGKRGIEPRKGMHDFPGGFVDFGENAYEAAIREAREELGIDIAKENLELIEAYHNDYDADVFTIDLIFLVRKWSGKPVADDDMATLEWKPINFLQDPAFAQKHYDGLETLLQTRSKGFK